MNKPKLKMYRNDIGVYCTIGQIILACETVKMSDDKIKKVLGEIFNDDGDLNTDVMDKYFEIV